MKVIDLAGPIANLWNLHCPQLLYLLLIHSINVPVPSMPSSLASQQGDCNTCVAHAVVAAAESAISTALQQAARSTLSEIDFFYCKATLGTAEMRWCSNTWTIREAVVAWCDAHKRQSYVILDKCMPKSVLSSSACSGYMCDDTDHALKLGAFTFQRLEGVWEMQDHIRQYGSIICRLQIYSNFKPFFEKYPGGIYKGPAGGFWWARRWV